MWGFFVLRETQGKYSCSSKWITMVSHPEHCLQKTKTLQWEVVVKSNSELQACFYTLAFWATPGLQVRGVFPSLPRQPLGFYWYCIPVDDLCQDWPRVYKSPQPSFWLGCKSLLIMTSQKAPELYEDTMVGGLRLEQLDWHPHWACQLQYPVESVCHRSLSRVIHKMGRRKGWWWICTW